MRHIIDVLRESRAIRRLVLPILSRIGRHDATIRHHYTGDSVRLNRFKHRNYWSMGRRREAETISLVGKFVQSGDVCYDVGANIGYISLILARLACDGGKVYAFEPDPNNLTYLRQNVEAKANVSIVEAGVAAEAGELQLYAEDLTGQNSSFIRDFDQLSLNAATAGVRPRIVPVTVRVVTLDDFAQAREGPPRFIKIDVEGFELEVLRGGIELLRSHGPALIVEVHERRENQVGVFDFLRQADYRIFDVSSLHEMSAAESLRLNILCLKSEPDLEILSRLRLAERAGNDGGTRAGH